MIVGSRNMIEISKIWVCEKSDRQRESFLPFLSAFYCFWWDKILESAMDKWEVKCNAKLCPTCFCVSVFVLAVVFRRQIKKTRQFSLKLWVFQKMLAKCNSKYGNVHRKIIRKYFHITLHFLFIHCTFQNSAPFKNNK